MFITTCIEIMILQSFMMLWDERKCTIEIKKHDFDNGKCFSMKIINVVVKVELSEIR